MGVRGDESDRTHFRLDLLSKKVSIDIKLESGESLKGFVRDLSNGGVSFILLEEKNQLLDGATPLIKFELENKIFEFKIKIIRQVIKNECVYYSAQFIDISKIKKSQLSLFLMKVKLSTE
jgi:c-di-GMP-binding flagellar brake protein YcgR